MKHVIYSLLFFCMFTIPTNTKISIQTIQHKVSSFFFKTKEATLQKEFNNINRLELLCDHGNISVHTWKQSSTLVEIKEQTTSKETIPPLVTFNQHEQLLQIQVNKEHKKFHSNHHINIITSENTDLKIATTSGNISIKHVSGSIEVQTESGNIEIIDGLNNISATSINGNILIQQEAIELSHTIEAKTDYGNLILQVPQHINSGLQATSKHGKIYSDLFITLHPMTIKLTDETYKQFKHAISGKITQTPNQEATGTIHVTTKSGMIKIKPYI